MRTIPLPESGGGAPKGFMAPPPPSPSATDGLSTAEVVDVNGTAEIIEYVVYDETQDLLEFNLEGSSAPINVPASGYTFDQGSQTITETANSTYDSSVLSGDVIYQDVTNVVAIPPEPTAPPTPAPAPIVTAPAAPAPVVVPTDPPTETPSAPVAPLTPPAAASGNLPAAISTMPMNVASQSVSFWLWLLILAVLLFISYRDGYRPTLT